MPGEVRPSPWQEFRNGVGGALSLATVATVIGFIGNPELSPPPELLYPLGAGAWYLAKSGSRDVAQVLTGYYGDF